MQILAAPPVGVPLVQQTQQLRHQVKAKDFPKTSREREAKWKYVLEVEITDLILFDVFSRRRAEFLLEAMHSLTFNFSIHTSFLVGVLLFVADFLAVHHFSVQDIILLNVPLFLHSVLIATMLGNGKLLRMLIKQPNILYLLVQFVICLVIRVRVVKRLLENMLLMVSHMRGIDWISI